MAMNKKIVSYKPKNLPNTGAGDDYNDNDSVVKRPANSGNNNKVIKKRPGSPAVAKTISSSSRATTSGVGKGKEKSIKEPKVKEPKVKEPKVKEPKVKEPKVKEPKVKEPKVKEPKVKESKVKEPKVKEPKVKEPKVKEPKVKSSKVKESGVKESKKRGSILDRLDVKTENATLFQNLGMLMVVMAFVIGAIGLYLGGSEKFAGYIFMYVLMAVVVMLICIKMNTIAVVVTAVQVIGFMAVRIYQILIAGDFYNSIGILWIVLPIITLCGSYLFWKMIGQTELDNKVLSQQVAELVMIDSRTGLYNLRSMYMDIQTQISYAERNSSAISLMVLKLRYPREMKEVLTDAQYDKVIKQLSTIIVDTVRLEDRVYSLNDEGAFGIVLTCDREGTRLVESRLREKLGDEKWFDEIADKPIRSEVKIGYLEYNKDRYHRDAKGFVEEVEDEAEYDL